MARTGAKSSKTWAAGLAGLARACGAGRRPDRRDRLDMVILAVLASGRGERTANRWLDALSRRFVDWNEVRVARTRDLTCAVSDVPAENLVKLQTFLQGMYEQVGGLDVTALVSMKPSEARSWLGRIEGLEREAVEAVLLIALGAPTLPAGEGLARVSRRLGLVPRKASRAEAHKLAAKGLAEDDYRAFYSLASEQAAGPCREDKPDCPRCRARTLCKSKGKW
ncbi:MAG TPA: hypothetical protein PK280_01555 [Planctomycetota bacterium]|nr:hypothetical protein [Planctomycetota bacterium]